MSWMELLRKTRWRRYVVPLIGGAALAASAVALTLTVSTRRELTRRIEQLELAAAAKDMASTAKDMASTVDVVLPSVGTIQFLKRGYSIEFEEVNYGENGLTLAGFLGNPTNLWLSNVTVGFTARSPRGITFDIDTLREVAGSQIGSAQARPIAVLAPGSRESFRVTVPNVKQTQEGFALMVALTGERYSYGR